MGLKGAEFHKLLMTQIYLIVSQAIKILGLPIVVFYKYEPHLMGL